MALTKETSVLALSSRADGRQLVTLLYDIRAAKHFAPKDQGYGLLAKNPTRIAGGSRLAGDGMVLQCRLKVSKFRLTLLTKEYKSPHYISQLGPAPRTASFLENIIEEVEDQTTCSIMKITNSWTELETCVSSIAVLTYHGSFTDSDHLVGTPARKCTVTFSLKLYTAPPIRLPTIGDGKISESQIRAKREARVKVYNGPKKKTQKRAERKSKRRQGAVMDVVIEAGDKGESTDNSSIKYLIRSSICQVQEPRTPIDENLREFAQPFFRRPTQSRQEC